jgi:glycosyltransferase involved in cell wall biosynthesis
MGATRGTDQMSMWRRMLHDSSLSLRKVVADRKLILLFYNEFEKDKFIRYDRYLKRVVRPVYNLTHARQKKTGFGVWFELLQTALVRQGWVVRVNDYSLARKQPGYPVGLVGFPSVLEGWNLPNPAILGPCLFDHPLIAPRLMEDPRFRIYVVVAEWMHDMFRPVYGDACVRWFGGIDTDVWTDMSSHPKDIDFLVYDKIRWDREKLVPELLQPILDVLTHRGFRTHVIRYKYYDHRTYRRLLERSRAMIFLCEHETQGLAYQEALACNVPILAWDNGYWLDPLWKQVSNVMVPASSVPFFSRECGDRFADLDQFEEALTRFHDRMNRYQPRKYVLENLSWERSGTIYSRAYFSLMNG